MGMFQKILVPFDGSEHAQRALTQAVALAELCDAKLVLLHVVDLNKKISALEQVSTGGYVPGEVQEEGRCMLAEALNHVSKEIKAESVVAVGLPSEVIVDICRDGGYDLIVMGNRGFGAIKQLFMGSVSQYVLCHAACPVMIIR